MPNIMGEQLAQVDNPDPFASPVWRSPVYRTPEFVIWLVQLARLIWRIIWFALRHPLLDLAALGVTEVWLQAGWPGLTALAAVDLGRRWRYCGSRWPDWFARLVTVPVRCRWRWWYYRRRWQAVMTITRLAPTYRGRVIIPVLDGVEVTGCTDRVTVALVSGQSPADFAARAEGLAHGFGALPVPGPLIPPRGGGPGAGPQRRARRPHPRPADPGDAGSAGAAGRAAGGRQAVHGPAARARTC